MQVQQFAELGFDEDDVEMALIHGSEKDKDSVSRDCMCYSM